LYPVWATLPTAQAADAEPLRRLPDRAGLHDGSPPRALSIEQRARAADRVAGPRASPLAGF